MVTHVSNDPDETIVCRIDRNVADFRPSRCDQIILTKAKNGVRPLEGDIVDLYDSLLLTGIENEHDRFTKLVKRVPQNVRRVNDGVNEAEEKLHRLRLENSVQSKNS